MLFFRLFSTNIEPRCAYCRWGRTADEETVLCRKKGVMDQGDSCSLFRYDPLKRVPPSHAALDLSRLRDEDFTL